MDYQKLRKWLKFFEREEVSANRAVELLYVYVYDNYVSFEPPAFPAERAVAE